MKKRNFSDVHYMKYNLLIIFRNIWEGKNVYASMLEGRGIKSCGQP